MRAVLPMRAPLLLTILAVFGCMPLRAQPPSPDGARSWPVDTVLARYERDVRASVVTSRAENVLSDILDLRNAPRARRDSLLDGLERLALSTDNHDVRHGAVWRLGHAGHVERASPAPGNVARLGRVYRRSPSWQVRSSIIDHLLEQADRRAAVAVLRSIATEPYSSRPPGTDEMTDLRDIALVRLAQMGGEGRAALRAMHRNGEARSPFVRRELEEMARQGFPVEDHRHAPPLLGCDCVTHIAVCVVDQDQLREVRARYQAETGDTIVQDRPFSHVYALTPDYGAAAGWFTRREPITLGGRVYMQAGLPRVMGIEDLAPVGAYHGVPFFAARDTARHGRDRLYVPIRTGCEFQPYEPRS